jgi:hypothetical protein
MYVHNCTYVDTYMYYHVFMWIFKATNNSELLQSTYPAIGKDSPIHQPLRWPSKSAAVSENPTVNDVTVYPKSQHT